MTTKARPSWQSVVSEMTNTQKLVHLAVRYDKATQDSIRAELTKARQRIYNDELAIQARRAGCDRGGDMQGGSILKQLNQMSKEDAASIANTYNLDLAQAILQISRDNPRSNRTVYAARLREWETNRAEGKAQQIAQWTENTARSKAQQDFYKNNGLEGVAVLQPSVAVCPVCQGWINRGEVSIKIAQNNPPPYHLKCPHEWSNRPEKVERADCADLWVG